MLYSKQELKNCIFFDVETAPKSTYANLNETEKDIWERKYAPKAILKEIELKKQEANIIHFKDDYKFNSNNTKEIQVEFTKEYIFNKYAPLHAEFAMVICISVGMFEDNMSYTLTSISNEKRNLENEKVILDEFNTFLSGNDKMILSGYNIEQFDIPFLIKRCLIQGLFLPKLLQLRGKKPWEITILDLMKDWKGLMWESVALEVVCMAFNIQTPKDKFDGSEMNKLLSSGKIGIKDVEEYCEKDVKACMLICLKMSK